MVRSAEEVGTWFRTWTSEARFSPQKDGGSPASDSIAVIPFPRVWFSCSVTLFCWGLLHIAINLVAPILVSRACTGRESAVVSKVMVLEGLIRR